MSDSKPWQDTPVCPQCSRQSVVVKYITVNQSVLRCVACGHAWKGTAEESDRAAKSDAAWEAEVERVYNDRFRDG